MEALPYQVPGTVPSGVPPGVAYRATVPCNAATTVEAGTVVVDEGATTTRCCSVVVERATGPAADPVPDEHEAASRLTMTTTDQTAILTGRAPGRGSLFHGIDHHPVTAGATGAIGAGDASGVTTTVASLSVDVTVTPPTGAPVGAGYDAEATLVYPVWSDDCWQ